MSKSNLILASFFLILSSCDEAQLQDLSQNGCTDPLAINYNINAASNANDTCRFSSLIFYGLKTDSLKYPVTIEFDLLTDILILNGPVSIVPQACLDGISGTTKLNLTSSETLSWAATTKASDMQTDSLIFSGKIAPNQIQACIQIHIATP